MFEKLGKRISDDVGKNIEGISNDQREVISYTVVQLGSEIFKTIIIFLIAVALGIEKLLIIAIFSMAIYRIPSGGAHSKSNMACFVTSSILFFGNILVSLNIRGDYLDLIYLGIFAFNCIIIYFFAPADTEMKPVVNIEQRRNLRIISFLCMLVTILIGRFMVEDITIRNIFIFGTFIQSFTMLPFLYGILGTKYGYRDGIVVPQI